MGNFASRQTSEHPTNLLMAAKTNNKITAMSRLLMFLFTLLVMGCGTSCAGNEPTEVA